MNELKIFENHDFGQVRTIEENGNVLFCGSDVAKALGYADTAKAITAHCKSDGWAIHPVIDSLGRTQQAKFIDEGNVYRLIAHSKLPTAEKFERWVFDEVLPSIRKTGGYIAGEENMSDDELLARALQVAQIKLAERDARLGRLAAENSRLTVLNEIAAPKAEYFDQLVERNLLTNFRETAKEFGIQQRTFINFLFDQKYIYRDQRGRIMPYANKNDGLFEVKESVNEKTKWSGTQTLITPKGREAFRLLTQGL